MAVVLDPRDARPLSSREIAKVLLGLLGGVVVHEPEARGEIPGMLAVELKRPGAVVGIRRASWKTAFRATVAGLRGWCNERDVNTALAWIADNHERAIPGGSYVTRVN